MRRVLLPLLLACACSGADSGPREAPTSTLSWSRADGAIVRDGRPLGSLLVDDGFVGVTGRDLVARITREEALVEPGHAWPRRVTLTGYVQGGDAFFRDAYTVLAPPAPLPVEGYGLEVAEDEPGTNTEEHRKLEAWLAGQGLPADASRFQALHEAETGRELRVFYEISGRRIDGDFGRVGADVPLARTDSLFRSQDGALKIHHQRPGENGRFSYHRRSLELADVLDPGPGEPGLHAHECGCYGYAIAADFMTLGDRLYRVEADWLDDRVAADFFLGLEGREGFPWIGLGDRLRMRDLARRARAWTLKDAAAIPFAEVWLELPEDPPSPGLGPITYHVDALDGDGGRTPIARIAHTDAGITIETFGEGDASAVLAHLDRLLAAMPVQVVRGDGLRDSHLGGIELLIDAVRLLEAPGDDERLADLVSDRDAATAARKVETLLTGLGAPERFVAAADVWPPDPIAGPGRPAAPLARQ